MGTGLRIARTVWVALVLIASAAPAWAGPAEAARRGDPCQTLAGVTAVLVLVLLLLAAKAAAVAFTLCGTLWRPDLFSRGRVVLATAPWKCFLVGLVNVGLGLLASAALLGNAQTKLLGLLLFLALLLVVILSRGLLYQLLGMKLVGEWSESGGPPSVRAHCWGGVAIEAAFLAPVVGQVAMVIATVASAGALILAWMSRERGAVAPK